MLVLGDAYSSSDRLWGCIDDSLSPDGRTVKIRHIDRKIDCRQRVLSRARCYCDKVGLIRLATVVVQHPFLTLDTKSGSMLRHGLTLFILRCAAAENQASIAQITCIPGFLGPQVVQSQKCPTSRPSCAFSFRFKIAAAAASSVISLVGLVFVASLLRSVMPLW